MTETLVPRTLPGTVRSHATHWIDGRWRFNCSTDTVEVTDPATGSPLATVPAGTPADAEAAVDAAKLAFPSWSALPLDERLRYLERLSELLEQHADTMADLVTAETGMPRMLTRHVQYPYAAESLRSYIELARSHQWEERIGHSVVRREAAGVVACLTPWNAPLALIMQKVPAALAAGCAVVLKPSELAPLNAYLLAELTAEAGFPPGVFNLVCGTGPVVGEALAAHPDVAVVSLTGSLRAGQRVSELAARRAAKVGLELGGKSASIVLSDADLDHAVTSTVDQAMFNSGQVCFAWSRLLVPAARYDEAVTLAARTASALPVGTPWNPATRVGPVIHSQARDRIIGMIDEATRQGAKVVCGGTAPDEPGEGSFVSPTVLADVRPDMRVATEEVFGPVLAVLSYEDEDDAVRIADATDYGLSGAVWSTDIDHATAVAGRLRTGRVDINGAPFNMRAPFGGYKSSGNGRELGTWGLDAFCETKAIQYPPAAGPEPGIRIRSGTGAQHES
ncbi:aldehyde dehydrogenase family protein [Kibdelosporangium persicum]|uniref:NAD-dependent aldehyde dehydrogenase n=1 Tax=Kibdelosporangium persicum TaxID=2698649 RepID=A0ABX2FJC7_9PSEU|nr:aldehyde dehydrogenase family protein [Kibdelosporangium persicum]NRN70858.1 NAD-dependent aldehyde dehydrogenase [Kibdelosporangium persicum]